MPDPVAYELAGPVATITVDDGKVNAFSLELLSALYEAFERARRDGAAVLLTGRPGYFSAGFDLNQLRESPGAARALVLADARLVQLILAFPAPVVVACTGHAYPAGAFLLLAADARLGAAGPFRLGYNEVRIGLTVPRFAVELARHRLHPAYADRTLVTGELFDPAQAVTAGFLDRVLPPAGLAAAARELVTDLATLDRRAHVETKQRIRGPVLAAVATALAADEAAATPV
jgi:enoyl-CoA hydratase/carnithine racemase